MNKTGSFQFNHFKWFYGFIVKYYFCKLKIHFAKLINMKQKFLFLKPDFFFQF